MRRAARGRSQGRHVAVLARIGSADEHAVRDEDRLPAAEAERVLVEAYPEARAREAGAAILQDDPSARRDDARAEAAEEALDERDRSALAVHGAQVDRAPARLRC